MRAGTDRDCQSHAGRQSPAGDPDCLPARELEAWWSAGRGRQTRSETHHALLQNEAHGHRAARGPLARLTSGGTTVLVGESISPLISNTVHTFPIYGATLGSLSCASTSKCSRAASQ